MRFRMPWYSWGGLKPDRQRIGFLFRALGYRNYRLFCIGQIVSLCGTWLTFAAMGWLINRLTGDPFMLGLIGFFMHMPTFLLAPVGGVVSDRVDRRRMMLATQALDMVVMLCLAAVTLLGQVQVWHVLTACALLGLIKAFDMPARQAMVAEVVEDRNVLTNAIALNSSIFHGARLVGPLIAGVLIIPFFGEYGEGVCFLLDGLSYVAVLTSLWLIRLKPREAPGQRKHVLHDMYDGAAYAFGFAPVRAIIVLMGLIAMLGVPYGTLLPVFADEVLGGTERTFGLLMAASGLGAVTGALYLASRPSVLGLGRIIAVCVIGFGLAIIGFGQSMQVWLSVLLLAVAGGTSMVAMAGTNTIVQTLVDDGMRGRVMSLFAMTFMGAMPVGALLFGWFARLVDAPTTLLLGGLACMAGGVAFGLKLPALRPLVRPIYVERGVIVEPDSSSSQVR